MFYVQTINGRPIITNNPRGPDAKHFDDFCDAIGWVVALDPGLQTLANTHSESMAIEAAIFLCERRIICDLF